MEPREQPAEIKIGDPTPEIQLVMASIERLKQCGLPEIRTMASWAHVALTRNPSENRAQLAPLIQKKRTSQGNAARIVMEGNSPDTIHFKLQVDVNGFSDKKPEQVDSELIPYFFILGAFEKAVTAESIKIVDSEITYADSYRAVYQQAFDKQFLYQEWVNQQHAANDQKQPLFPNVAESRIHLVSRLQQLLFGTIESGMPKIDFGIHDYLVLIDASLPEIYRNLRVKGKPLLEAQNLAGNPAAQEDFLAQLSLLFMLYRPPDETFEEAVIATANLDLLDIMQVPQNLDDLTDLIDKSKHPLRSFIFVRAMLYQKAIYHALSLYNSVTLPDTEGLRDFQDMNVDNIDTRLLGVIATGDLFLEKIFQSGQNDYGFGPNDRRQSG